MSPADIVILILAVLCVAGAIGLALWRRKTGRSGCSGGCAGCPHAGGCERRPPSDTGRGR